MALTQLGRLRSAIYDSFGQSSLDWTSKDQKTLWRAIILDQTEETDDNGYIQGNLTLLMVSSLDNSTIRLTDTFESILCVFLPSQVQTKAWLKDKGYLWLVKGNYTKEDIPDDS